MERRGFLGALGALAAGVAGLRRQPLQVATDLTTLQPTLVPLVAETPAGAVDGSTWVSYRVLPSSDTVTVRYQMSPDGVTWVDMPTLYYQSDA